MTILYRTDVTTTGGRTGTSKSSDGRLSITLDTVKELGGAGGDGTNPEQLFAAGYSACFIGAMQFVAGQKKLKLDPATTVTATVGIGPREDGKGFGLEIALSVSIPNMDRAAAEELVAAADVVCPYSHLVHNGLGASGRPPDAWATFPPRRHSRKTGSAASKLFQSLAATGAVSTSS